MNGIIIITSISRSTVIKITRVLIPIIGVKTVSVTPHSHAFLLCDSFTFIRIGYIELITRPTESILEISWDCIVSRGVIINLIYPDFCSFEVSLFRNV